MVNKKYKTVAEYISSFPGDIKNVLKKLRKVIKGSAPEAQETISYAIPTFRLKGINPVHFAAFKNHIGFYPAPSAIDTFHDDLSHYEISKGTIKFPYGRPIPFMLIKDIIKFRLSEVLASDNKQEV